MNKDDYNKAVCSSEEMHEVDANVDAAAAAEHRWNGGWMQVSCKYIETALSTDKTELCRVAGWRQPENRSASVSFSFVEIYYNYFII